MNRSKSVSLTEGSVWKVLLTFMVPILLADILNQVYNLTNALLVGNYVNTEALSAISATSQVIGLFEKLFYGISMASGIIVSNYFGANKKEEVSRTIENILIITFSLGLVITIISELLVPTFLSWSNVQADIYNLAAKYLRIYILGSIPYFTYIACFFIMRATGDSKHPLYYLVVSCFTNLILGFIFVRFLNLSVVGVASATIISQTVVVVLSLITISRSEVYNIDIKKTKIEPDIIRRVFTLGIPVAIQNMLIGISSMLVQSFTNTFSIEAIAGIGVAEKIINLACVPTLTVVSVITTFVGQNMGAEKYDRVKKGVKFCIIFVTVIMLIIATLSSVFAPALVSLFDSNINVVKYGSEMLRYTIFSFILFGWSHVYNGACRGSGNMKLPLMIAVMTQCLFRYLFVAIGISIVHDIRIIYWSQALVCIISGLAACLYYHNSKWTKDHSMV